MYVEWNALTFGKSIKEKKVCLITIFLRHTRQLLKKNVHFLAPLPFFHPDADLIVYKRTTIRILPISLRRLLSNHNA